MWNLLAVTARECPDGLSAEVIEVVEADRQEHLQRQT